MEELVDISNVHPFGSTKNVEKEAYIIFLPENLNTKLEQQMKALSTDTDESR